MEEFRPRRSLENIRDSRLTAVDRSIKKHEIAQQEHKRELESREQSHTHLINEKLIKALTTDLWYTRLGSFILCIFLLVFIGTAVYLIASENFKVSPGLGFTLGLISGALATFFQKLIEKMWDFSDLHKLINKDENHTNTFRK